MENSAVKYVLGAMARLLRPLVKMLIERGISYDQAADILRKTYCDVAFGEDFALPGRKQTDSRVSVLTGLTRKDVARLKTMTLESPGLLGAYNRATRVVTGWMMTYPMEGTPSGAASLPLEGDERSFSEVVRMFSGDMPVRAVLDELLRIGAVRVRDDEVELIYRHYIPLPGEENKIEYLGVDVSDLISTISHNLNAAPDKTRLQRKAYYDDIPVEYIDELHTLVKEIALPLIERAARQMSRFDREMNPELKGTERHRVSFGVYFAQEKLSDEPRIDKSVPN